MYFTEYKAFADEDRDIVIHNYLYLVEKVNQLTNSAQTLHYKHRTATLDSSFIKCISLWVNAMGDRIFTR